MLKEEVRNLLNSSNLNYYLSVKEFTKFISEKENKRKILDYIYKKVAVNKKENVKHLLKYFIEVTYPLVSNTRLCKSTQSAKVYLKTVWVSSGFQNTVIDYIKNYSKYQKVEKEKEKEELTLYERRVLQAKKAREAKARKAKERAEKERKASKKPQKKETKTDVDKKETEADDQSSKFSKEDLARIALLKNMSV